MSADQLIPLVPADGRGWTQVTISFPRWTDAETVAAAHLLPLLREHPDAAEWWFIRKRPSWRLRYRPGRPDTDRHIAAALDTLTTTGALHSWSPAVYEPEQVAFGGPDGIAVAHRLFHHDSHAILYHLHQPAPGLPGRRELTVVAVTTLLRSAGLDWYEQGDVWANIALHRPDRAATTPATTAASAMRRLLTLDIDTLHIDRPRTGHTDGADTAEPGPLGPWLAGFATTGRTLGQLARTGRLLRGLRAVLTHQVIFHWNRLGLPYLDQRALAVLARDAILDTVSDPPPTGVIGDAS